MNASQKFVYTHRAKLAWKYVKHGLGTVLEGQKGQDASKQTGSDSHTEDFIMVPIHH